MQAIRLTLPAEEAAQQSPAKNKATAGRDATAFPTILSGVQLSSGDAAEGGGRAIQRLILGGDGTAGLEGKTVNGEEGDLAALFGGALLRAGEGEGQKRLVVSGEGGKAKGKKGPSASGDASKLMPVLHVGEDGTAKLLVGRAARAAKQNGSQAAVEGKNAQSSGQKSDGGAQVRVSWGRVAPTSGDGTARPGAKAPASSGAGSGRAKQVQVSPGTIAADSGEGRPSQGTDGQAPGKRGAGKRMPEGSQAGASARKGGGAQGHESPLLGGGKGRSGQNAGRLSMNVNNESRPQGQVRGEAGRAQDASSGQRGDRGTDSTRGRPLSPSSLKGGNSEPGGGREALTDGRSARTARDGARSTGRQGRGRTGHQGGKGQQGGGQQGQGTGQNGQGQKGQAQGSKNGHGIQAPVSSSASTSGESEARTLRASLTRDGASTGSGTQTDGKGANSSGAGSGTASKGQADARPQGKSGPPRTMPSAWLNAAKHGPLRTAELAGGWKSLEMSLGEDKGTMTVRARQGREQTAVSVGFSEARVQAQVAANARQLQEAMQAQYGTDVDLSFSGGDASESDQHASDGAGSERPSTLAPGDESSDENQSGGSTLRSRGRREWVG